MESLEFIDYDVEGGLKSLRERGITVLRGFPPPV